MFILCLVSIKLLLLGTYFWTYCTSKKGKGFRYWVLSVGLGADPGVQAVSPQVT